MIAVMKRTLAATVALALTFGALALTLQYDTTLELRNDAGDLIGVGKVDDAGLSFHLLADQQGFGVLTVFDPVGIEETYDALINEAGEVVVVIDQQMVTLRQLAEDAGIGFQYQMDDGAGGLGGVNTGK